MDSRLWFQQAVLPYNALICRYNEIGTKGRNRGKFEERLADGLRRALSPLGDIRILFEHGRLFVVPSEEGKVFSASDLELVRRRVPYVAGVASVSPGLLVEPTLEAIDAAMERHLSEIVRAFLEVHDTEPFTYAMQARRCDKSFPLTSAQLEIRYGEQVLKRWPQFHLDLTKAALRIELEVRFHQAFISIERIAGPGGLPGGSSGRVLALLSGGIDSPVACYQMMRRGCIVDFITFHSEPYTPPAYLTKICGIALHLNKIQKRGRLFATNLIEAQKAIRDTCKSKYRTVLYRRMMLRVASALATALETSALVTGDNLGQVASQTLANMAVIDNATSLLTLRPLLTFDKLDTVAIAQNIGTYPLSIENVPDSCSVFAPDDPATNAELVRVEEDERHLDIPALLAGCLKQTVLLNPLTMEQTDLSATWLRDRIGK